MAQYSLYYDPVQWLDTMIHNDGQFGPHRISSSSPHNTLLSSCFAVLARETIGALNLFSSSQLQEWSQYIAKHQSSESGLFLDPLLDRNDLSKRGHNWQYITWQFTFFSLAALDALEAQANYPLSFVEIFLDSNKIEHWLANRDWSDPWLESNNIMFLISFLIQEWERTGNLTYSKAAHTILDWLDEYQNPKTGYWDLNRGASLLNAMAGAFHLYFFYFYLGRPVNYPERIIDSTLALQEPDGLFDQRGGGRACLDMDAIDILVKFSLLTEHRVTEIKEALRHAFEAILMNQNPDGGFCEAKRPPLWQKSLKRRVAESVGLDRLLNRSWRGRPIEHKHYSSWDKMRYWVDESDLWSTWSRVYTLALISSRYPDEFIDDINWQFRSSPTLGWHNESQLEFLGEQLYT